MRKVGDGEDIGKLRAALHGELILPTDQQYETARRVWNGAIDRHSALIVRCADVSDVRRAVEFARQANRDIAVCGGGHSWPGFSTCEGGIVFDLSQMKAVSVDPKARTARAEPGVTLGGLIAATQAYGLGTNTGTVSDTGIAGLTLGGALFCDRRYDHVFVYHNGAKSYYAARAFLVTHFRKVTSLFLYHVHKNQMRANKACT